VPTLQRLLKKLKFIDETGVHVGLTRLFGRAAPGERVVEATPGYSGLHYTVVAALGWQAVSAPWVFEGAMNSLAFETYVEFILCPTVQRGEVVLMDNLSAHKRTSIRQLIEARGARVEFLPPYSSDLNPIELCWAKVKTALRQAKARTFETLVDALADAFRSVTLIDIQAWFAHCGYALP
jgi:transposase